MVDRSPWQELDAVFDRRAAGDHHWWIIRVAGGRGDDPLDLSGTPLQHR